MNKMTLARQLIAMGSVVVLAFLAYGVWSIDRLRLTAVNGAIYDMIKSGQQLESQVVPPDLNIMESYLVVNKLVRASGALARESFAEQLGALQKKYEAGHEYWKQQTLPADIGNLLLVQSYEPAHSFFQVVFENLIPALNERNEAATKDAFEKLDGYYNQHQEAVAQLLTDITTMTAAREADASGLIRSTVLWMVVVLIVLTGVVGGWFYYTGRSVLRTLGGEPAKIKEVVRELAKGDLTAQLVVQQGDTESVLAGISQMRDQIGELVRDIQRAGVQVTSSSTQLSASAKELQATINETVASSHEVTASSKQISATREELQSTMADVAAMTNQTAQAAGEGQSGLQRMTGTMQAMEVASREIGQKLAAINEKVTNITTVVTTITKIADQTNLLSLNASIEAAKAGEYGRGFSVVAREIRRLADQTAVATLDIEKMVNDMQSSVSSGVMGMEKFAQDVQGTVSEVTTIGSQVTNIIEQIQALSPNIESVNQGMEQQSVGANQITVAMTQLGQLTMASAQSQRQLDQVTAGLQGAAAELQRSVQRFVLAR